MNVFPSGGRSIKRGVRRETATVIEHTKGPRGGETKYRFPMPDKAHARNALARLPQAKGLSAKEKAKIRRRALRILGKRKKKVNAWTEELRKVREYKKRRGL